MVAHSIPFRLCYREAKRKKNIYIYKKRGEGGTSSGGERNQQALGFFRTVCLISLQHLSEVGRALATSRTPHHCLKALENFQGLGKERLNSFPYYPLPCYLYTCVIYSTHPPFSVLSKKKKKKKNIACNFQQTLSREVSFLT